MAIVFVNAGAGDATTGTSLSLGYPASIADGDLLIVHIGWHSASGNRGDYTLPSGWTQVTAREGPNQQNEHAIFWKIRSGESGSLSVTVTTPGTSSVASGRMYAFSGAHQTTPFTAGNTQSSAAATSCTQPSITTPASPGGRAVVFVYIGDDQVGGTAVSSFTGESNGDLTEAAAEYATSTGLDACHSLQIDSADRVSTTVSGGSFTYGPSAAYIARSFAINVAPTVYSRTASIGATVSVASYRTAERVAASTSTASVYASTMRIRSPRAFEYQYLKPPRWAWSPARLPVEAQNLLKKLVAAIPFWESEGPSFILNAGGTLAATESEYTTPTRVATARGLAPQSSSGGYGQHSSAITAGHPLRVSSPFSWWIHGRKNSNGANSGLIFGFSYDYGNDTAPYTVLAAFQNATDGTMSCSTNDAGSELQLAAAGSTVSNAEHTLYAERVVATNGGRLLLDNAAYGTAGSPTGQPGWSSSGGVLGYGVYPGNPGSVYSGWQLNVAYVFRDVLTDSERQLLAGDPFLLIRPAQFFYRPFTGPVVYQCSATISATATIAANRSASRVAASSSTASVVAGRTAFSAAAISATATVTAYRVSGRVASVSSTATASAIRTKGESAASSSTASISAIRSTGRVAAITATISVSAAKTWNVTATVSAAAVVLANRRADRIASIAATVDVSAAKTWNVTSVISSTAVVLANRSAGRVAAIGASVSVSVAQNWTVTATISATAVVLANRRADRVASISAACSVNGVIGASRVAAISSTAIVAAVKTSVLVAASSSTASITANKSAGRVATSTSSASVTTIRRADRKADITALAGISATVSGTASASISATATIEANRGASRVSAISASASVAALQTIGRVASSSSTAAISALREAGRVASISSSASITAIATGAGPQAQISATAVIDAARSVSRTVAVDAAAVVASYATSGRTASISASSAVESIRSAERIADIAVAASVEVSQGTFFQRTASILVVAIADFHRPYWIPSMTPGIFLREFIGDIELADAAEARQSGTAGDVVESSDATISSSSIADNEPESIVRW